MSCKFRITFVKDEENFIFNEASSFCKHHHKFNLKSLPKVRLNQIKAFIKDKMEDIKPKDIAEKIKYKFGVELDYQ